MEEERKKRGGSGEKKRWMTTDGDRKHKRGRIATTV